MNETKQRLLQAACEAAGGSARLALRLGVSETMLQKCLSGQFPVPDPLFLTAVDFYVERGDQSPDVFGE